MTNARIIARVCATAFALCAVVCLYACSSSLAKRATCNRIAAPNGNDHRGHGTRRRPYRTLRRLDSSLRPGQTGCLRGGTYGGLHTWTPLFKSGTGRERITIRAYPSERALVRGWISIEGSYTTVSGLEIDGANTFYDQVRSGTHCRSGVSQALSITGHNDVFERNNFYQSVPSLRGVGIGIGFFGNADHTVIRNNKIHDVGQCEDYDQAIYLDSGRNTRIYDNWIWNDAHGWGIQIYPSASYAQIFGNVIDQAGSGIVLGGESSTSHNRIAHNVILDSTGLPRANLRGVAISDYWEGTPGSGNSFVDNDSYRNPGGIGHARGVRMAGNVKVRPPFVNAADHNYGVLSTGLLGRWDLLHG